MSHNADFPDVLAPVLRYFGGVTALARAIGRSPQAIYGWADTGTVPRLAAYDIQAASQGRFRAHQLNSQCLDSHE